MKCPGCGERLEVDPASGRVMALGKEERPHDLSEAVQRSQTRAEGVGDSFAAALEAERNRKQELEDAFRKAAQKAKDGDPEERPDAPLDDRWR